MNTKKAAQRKPKRSQATKGPTSIELYHGNFGLGRPEARK